MTTNNIVSRAMAIRERTKGTTILFLPSILLAICYALSTTIFRLFTFLSLRQDSALVESRLVSSVTLAYFSREGILLLLQLLIGLASFSSAGIIQR